MSITEHDEVRTMNLFKEEYLAEGRAEGFLTALITLIKNGLPGKADAAAQANMTVAEFDEAVKTLG